MSNNSLPKSVYALRDSMIPLLSEAGKHFLDVRTCILCGKETFGSVGAAGIKWKIVCQPCKDVEDGILAAQLKGLGVCLSARIVK